MTAGVVIFVLALAAAGALVQFGLAWVLAGLWQRWAGEIVMAERRIPAEEHHRILAAGLEHHTAKWSSSPSVSAEAVETATAQTLELVGRPTAVLPPAAKRRASSRGTPPD